jgi:hypothetical protein
MSKEKRILVSMAVADGPPHTRVRKRTGRCEICGTAVWIGRSSPRVDLYRCMKCFEETRGPDDMPKPPTSKQWAEVAAYFRKQRQ